AVLSGYQESLSTMVKIFALVVFDVAVLVAILFATSVLAGFYFFEKNEDPNNFLIPITTSIADFGNLVLLSGLVVLLFQA
ncbi:MAG: hypothetical protein V1717_02050, partial [Candidatus Micrarchaeota archaeon]